MIISKRKIWHPVEIKILAQFRRGIWMEVADQLQNQIGLVCRTTGEQFSRQVMRQMENGVEVRDETI